MQVVMIIAIAFNLLLSGLGTAFVFRHMQDHDGHVRRLSEVQQSVERIRWLVENPDAPRR